MDSITDAMMAGDIRACSDRSIAALQSGVSDIRAVSGFLLGVFNQRGPEALPDIADVLCEVLAKRWHCLGPERNRDRVADSCLVLFFRVLRSSVEFRESRRDEEWQRWAVTMPTDLGPSAVSALTRLSATVTQIIAKPRSNAELDRLCARAEALFRPKAPCPTDPTFDVQVTAAQAPTTDIPPPAPDILPAAPIIMAEVAADPVAALRSTCSSPVSSPFQLLLRKLAAFETLVERAQMAKAAIVAADLNEIFEHFDPRVYFPAILAPYFRALNEHIEELAPHLNRASDPVCQAQQQLYGVDLDAFMDSK